MIQFTVKVGDLNKAMATVSLATVDMPDKISSHALFTIANGMALVRSTDEDRVAFSQMPVDCADEAKFTVDPKNVISLLRTADGDTVKFRYDAETKTVDLFASDNEDAYVSLPSFDPDQFLDFDDLLKGSVTVGTIGSGVLGTAFRFQLGFVSADEKNAKFANLYIADGIMYGSNGATKIGVFRSEDFKDVVRLTIRRAMLPNILALADKLGLTDVVVKETEKMALFTSPDGLSGFGFRKSVIEMPKMPVPTDTPPGDGISLDRAMFMKKVSRISVGMRGDAMNVEMTVDGDMLTMKTMADRKSVEKIPCKRLSGKDPLRFLMECKLTEATLALFKADTISLYVGKNRCTLYSVVPATEKEKASTSIGLLSLPREI